MITCDALERDFNRRFPPGGIDAKLDTTSFFNANISFNYFLFKKNIY